MPMEEASEFQFPLEVVEAAKSLAQSFRNIKPKDGLFGLALVSTAVGGWFFFRHVMRAPTHSELAQRIREESRRRPMVVGSKCKGDVKVLLKLDALEAAEGCEKKVCFHAHVNGGQVQRTAVLNVPPKVSDGHKIRLKGLGSMIPGTGEQGDLVLELLVEEE